MTSDGQPLTEREIKILLTKAEKDPYYVLTNKDCHRKSFCARFLTLCNEVIFATPDKALEQFFIARRLAKETRDSHLIARATAMIATGYRIEALYPKAEQYIQKAKAHANGCLCCLAEICRRHGLILAYQRRFDAAYATLSHAREHYEQQHNAEGVARVLIHRGTVLDAMGRYPEALADEKNGLALFSPDTPSRYYIAGMVNMAAVLLNFEQYDEALSCLGKVRNTLKGTKRRHERVRVILRWIEGLIFAKQGRRGDAFKRLFSARNGIERFGFRSEYIAISADISKLYKTGTPRTNDDQVIEIAEECLEHWRPTKAERPILERLCLFPRVDVIDRLRQTASCRVPALI